MTIGGGEVAAYGLRYQYLATIDFFLHFLREHPELIQRATLVVDPLLAKSDGHDDDIVDFAIEIDSEATHHIQVKATTDPAKYPLQPAKARDALERLVSHGAEHSVILTNKPLSPDLANDCTVEDTNGPGTSYAWASGPQPKAQTSAQATIAVDTRPPAEVRSSIAELIRHFRKHGALGQGLTSARLLAAVLLDFVFDAAAGNESNRINALDLLAKIHMPDARIAHMAGGFDWGLPMTGIPNYASTVPRMAILDEVMEHLTPDDSQTVPPRVVLTGHTGLGKSVIATDYCHIDRISYEFLCWIDCRDTDLIAPRIRDIVSQLTKDVVPPAVDVGAIFTGLLGRIAGPWLLVFDGIQNASDIEKYVPTLGHGSILFTTNNSLGWWDSAHQIEITPFTENEAVDCFASYAGISGDALDAVRGTAEKIVRRLGRIPLAVSMSGLYFRNTQGRLDELTVQYFSDLAGLDDSLSIPRGFDKTAFTAIRFAVENLGKGMQTPHRRDAQALLYAGSLLAPELLPVNLLLPASVGQLHIRLKNLPKPEEVEPALRRGVIAVLRTQTIAHRVDNSEAGTLTPASETVAVHPLVHNILQRNCLSLVSPGELQSMASSLMFFLVGWIGILRTDGHFFAVEQLRMHAQALLDLVNEREPLSTPSPEHDKYYRYLKAMLQIELGTCEFSRGNLQRSYELGSSAVQVLSAIADDHDARLIAMKAVFDQINDLSFGEAPAPLLAVHAHVLVQFCDECEASGDEKVRDFAYALAGEALEMVTRIQSYRASPPLQEVATKFQDIGTRDPRADSRPHTRNILRNKLLDTGRYEEVLAGIPEWRVLDGGHHNAVIFDGMQVVAQLHTNRFDDALDGITKLLELKPYGQHLLVFTHEALKKIAKALYETTPIAAERADQLQQALDQVLARYDQLGGPPKDLPA